jgi:hypothetical protein
MGRGRKSHAELAALAIIPGTRPPPPPDLAAEEQVHWRAITSRLPQSWFTGENLPMLKLLCRHIHYADLLAADITALRQAPPVDVRALQSALRAHALQSERIAILSTKLRLTLQSRLDRETAGIEARKSAAGVKPWENWDSPTEN